jgi:hypothetical protein
MSAVMKLISLIKLDLDETVIAILLYFPETWHSKQTRQKLWRVAH